MRALLILSLISSSTFANTISVDDCENVKADNVILSKLIHDRKQQVDALKYAMPVFLPQYRDNITSIDVQLTEFIDSPVTKSHRDECIATVVKLLEDSGQ